MYSANHHFELNEHTYRLICDLIYRGSGLRFDESHRKILQGRLSARIRELHLDSFERYFYFIRYDESRDQEMEIVYDLLTTHETYFMREKRQLDAFEREIVPEMLNRTKETKSLRIWSAGCSTGEEPYTIAILCSQIPGLKNWALDIFASDISQTVLQKARNGIFGIHSFRNTDEHFRRTFFDPIQEDRFKVKEHIRRMVTFGKFNLLDTEKAAILGSFDVIFCRNVLIYFGMEARKTVIDNFYSKLSRDGFLLLGHAESLLTLSTKFKLRHLQNDMVYQK